MWPAFGRSRPTRVFRKTDFPVPEGPRSTEISHSGIVIVTSSQMVCRPNRLVSPSTRISTPTKTHLLLEPTRLTADCDRHHTAPLRSVRHEFGVIRPRLP